jgi:hypothetical protein
MNHFTEALGLSRYTLYMQNYGGPVDFEWHWSIRNASKRSLFRTRSRITKAADQIAQLVRDFVK